MPQARTYFLALPPVSRRIISWPSLLYQGVLFPGPLSCIRACYFLALFCIRACYFLALCPVSGRIMSWPSPVSGRVISWPSLLYQGVLFPGPLLYQGVLFPGPLSCIRACYFLALSSVSGRIIFWPSPVSVCRASRAFVEFDHAAGDIGRIPTALYVALRLSQQRERLFINLYEPSVAHALMARIQEREREAAATQRRLATNR